MNLVGSLFDYIAAFVGGVLLSLTPCVYPLIPVIVSFIGAINAPLKKQKFLLSLFYVLGIAVSYSMLGIISALSGKIFGQIQTNPITYFITGSIFILLGLSFLDVFSFGFFSIKQHIKPKNFLSIFFIGMVSALVISPCVSPGLGAILVYVGSKQNVFFGATLLLTFALGMGLPLIVIGTFSAILTNLPKSGVWLEKIKKICGIVLISIGFYFLTKGVKLL
ncbi:MAG: cytochrome c biogenesis protein CcdA [Candidatus Omnitrophota bacterium]